MTLQEIIVELENGVDDAGIGWDEPEIVASNLEYVIRDTLSKLKTLATQE